MTLTVQKRNIGDNLKALRKRGFIPAEFYAHGIENIHISVSAKEFGKIFKEAGESAIIKLKVNDAENEKEKEINVLIHDVQKNYLTDEIYNIDFYGVKMNEKINTSVPLVFIGESLAVKEGGILIKAVHELEIRALPADLPHHIEIDLSKLANIGDSILMKDIDLGKGVKSLVDAETVIATIVAPKVEEEIPVGPASVEEVKVESQEKKEAREKEKVAGEDL